MLFFCIQFLSLNLSASFFHFTSLYHFYIVSILILFFFFSIKLSLPSIFPPFFWFFLFFYISVCLSLSCSLSNFFNQSFTPLSILLFLFFPVAFFFLNKFFYCWKTLKGIIAEKFSVKTQKRLTEIYKMYKQFP